MTSKAEQHVPPPPAPWRPLFEKHVAKLSPSHFSFATVHQDASTGRVSPRVRTCIFRNFWTEIDAHPSAVESMKSTKHPAADFKTTAQLSQDSSAESNLEEGVNKKAFASDLFTFTTDVRMAKVEDLTGPDGKPGVDVEAGFWIEAVSTQWRIQGKAYVIGGNPDDETEKQAREEIGKRMRQREGASSEIIRNWNWEKEITAQFANLSPLMRGSFKNPLPGSPKSVPPSDPALGLGQKASDLYDEPARRNFRVVVICPEVVEAVDLTHPEAATREKWSLLEKGDGQGMEWKHEELWP